MDDQIMLYPTPVLKYINKKIKRENFLEVSIKVLHQLYVSEDSKTEKWLPVPSEDDEITIKS